MTHDSDPFAELVRENGTAAFQRKIKRQQVKIVQSERDAPMKLGPMEQAVANQGKLSANYRAAKRAEYKALLQGPNGDHWKNLAHVLRGITLDNPEDLIGFVSCQRWLHQATVHERQIAISMISAAIIQLRLESGYPPFDDGLPGEEPTCFQIIRDMLVVLT